MSHALDSGGGRAGPASPRCTGAPGRPGSVGWRRTPAPGTPIAPVSQDERAPHGHPSLRHFFHDFALAGMPPSAPRPSDACTRDHDLQEEPRWGRRRTPCFPRYWSRNGPEEMPQPHRPYRATIIRLDPTRTIGERTPRASFPKVFRVPAPVWGETSTVGHRCSNADFPILSDIDDPPFPTAGIEGPAQCTRDGLTAGSPCVERHFKRGGWSDAIDLITANPHVVAGQESVSSAVRIMRAITWRSCWWWWRGSAPQVEMRGSRSRILVPMHPPAKTIRPDLHQIDLQ
jgi:hypothetical protein